MPNELPLILIVDDNAKNIQFLAGLLMEHGYEVGVAQNAAMALDFVSVRLPDLILLDIMMPNVDGYEVCLRLKGDERVRDTPVIFVTALTEAADSARAFDVGAVDFVTKPFNVKTILARIDTHLTLARTVRELKNALEEVKRLHGLLPICSYCKSIRNDRGYWEAIEVYLSERADVDFSHTICRDCANKHFPDVKVARD